MGCIEPDFYPAMLTNHQDGLHSRFFVDTFFDLVDRLGESFGLNVPQVVYLEQLEQLPAHSLGRGLVDFLAANHLNALTTGPRRKQLHDSVHVLTGYGADPIGEAEVQSFLLGAKFSPIQVILGTSLISATRRHQPQINLGELKLRLYLAYRRGQNSNFDVDSWEPEWSMPVADIRQKYAIT